MKIRYHKDFVKHYKKRIVPYPKLVKQFEQQLATFLKEPTTPSLRDHKLIGKRKHFRAFSVTGDIRVVYTSSDNELWLYDIGSHNQVY